MLARTSTPATKTARMSAAALGMLLCASALTTTPAAGADSADILPTGGLLYGYFREARRGASVPAQGTESFDESRGLTDSHAPVSFDTETAQRAGLLADATARVRGQARALAAQYRPVAGSAPDLSANVDVPPSDIPARLHYVFGSDAGLKSDRARQDEGEVLLRNPDAFARAKVQLGVTKEWRGFVYADIGATDSELRWQGLAGIHGGLGVDLVGGWRHVTYHFTPGRGFDSLEFNGPFFGATLAW